MKPNRYQQPLRCFLVLSCVLAALSSPAQRATRDEAAEPKAVEPKAEPVDKSDPIEKSVVKIYATVRHPDHFKPWTKLSPGNLRGSGVVIDGHRILSNAHLLLYASEIQVEGNEADDKVSATVEFISPEIDLAVLKLDDESFFNSHPPLPRAKSLPATQDPVTVYGFPTGGSSMSITKGIVSRIEFTKYNYGSSGLRVQVDAAINPGNSGGPAVIDGKMIGLAFAHLSRAENISYIIPNEEIGLFLKSLAANSPYYGRPTIYVKLLELQNPALRSYLHLDKSAQGIVVENVPKTSDDPPLKKWDVITHIGNTPIDDEGMVRLDNGLRVAFLYLINATEKDGKAPLTVLRDGKELHLQVPTVTKPKLVLPGLEGSYPSYFIYGPLVFSDAYQDHLTDLLRAGSAWTTLLLDRGSPLFDRCDDPPAFDGERLVIITSVLPHKLSRGYPELTGEVIKSVNGIPIKNLAHLVATLRDCTDEFVRIDFDERLPQTLVYPRAEMVAATEDILNDNSARSQGSSDMMAIWNKPRN